MNLLIAFVWGAAALLWPMLAMYGGVRLLDRAPKPLLAVAVVALYAVSITWTVLYTHFAPAGWPFLLFGYMLAPVLAHRRERRRSPMAAKMVGNVVATLFAIPNMLIVFLYTILSRFFLSR